LTLAAEDAAQVRVIVRSLKPPMAEMLDVHPDSVALYFSDSRCPLETREEVLRRLFGLTEREAAVLRARVEGDDTQAIARRFGIGAETVKTHLRHVMQAVGVNRQDALIRLVLSSPAWISGPA
jgi:DNA-binding CsgD family transcriptional regulator